MVWTPWSLQEKGCWLWRRRQRATQVLSNQHAPSTIKESPSSAYHREIPSFVSGTPLSITAVVLATKVPYGTKVPKWHFHPLLSFRFAASNFIPHRFARRLLLA